MPYTVSFDEKDNVIGVRVSGDATREQHYAALNEALQLCQQNRCGRLIVDLRALDTTHFSITGCFTFGESLSEKPALLKIAHVMPTDKKAREDVRFVSTVEANRGVLTSEFETVEDAREWLLSETQSG
ncbi:MAG: hypothetical protein JXA13_12245 [Anaerolineales bacterium]|nr:hypothetical protein [Anaerolineales bacterium]